MEFSEAEDDVKDVIHLQHEQTSKASTGDYGLGSEGFCPREHARPQGHGIDIGGFSMERPLEGGTGDDEHEEESEGFHGDNTSFEMASESLSNGVHRMIERVVKDLAKMLQKYEEAIKRLGELQNGVLQHEQQQAQKIELAKRMLSGVI